MVEVIVKTVLTLWDLFRQDPPTGLHYDSSYEVWRTNKTDISVVSRPKRAANEYEYTLHVGWPEWKQEVIEWATEAEKITGAEICVVVSDYGVEREIRQRLIADEEEPTQGETIDVVPHETLSTEPSSDDLPRGPLEAVEQILGHGGRR